MGVMLPGVQTFLLLTRIYQHFYTTESPKVDAQCGVCAATSAAKQSVVILVHENTDSQYSIAC